MSYRSVMPKKLKLTSSTDETSVGELLSADAIFTIPYFQRPYKWLPKRLSQLEDDLRRLVDGTDDNHFLGAIIIHGRPTNPSDPNVYEVIDGQQRLTTLFLYICATVRALCKHSEHREAAGLFLRFIAINRPTSHISNVKLHSSKDDRQQMNHVITDLLSDAKLATELGSFSFKSLPALGAPTGRLWSNYRLAVRFFSDQAKTETLQRVRALYTVLLEQLSVVQIDVLDPVNGPKIFDSLNSRQEPMTTGDLVRNEIFSRVADSEPSEVESLDQQYWQPFYAKFKTETGSSFDDFFFPFGLVKNPNLKKSEVYAYLRAHWKDLKDPASIINDLAAYQEAFLDLENSSNLLHFEQPLSAIVQRVTRIIPASTYPFLMPLLNELKAGKLDIQSGTAVLSVMESFLVRRAICGHEPTGLHAVFKRLWVDCNGKLDAVTIRGAIQSHKTVVWPGDDEVRASVKTRALYGSSITRYVILEWNRQLGGDLPNIEPWIEHVLPEDALPPDWKQYFSEEEHKALKNTLANLLPLSQPMNQMLGTKGYSIKRPIYKEDSAFKAARLFAVNHETWTPEDIAQRAHLLADWVLKRWPY